MRLGLISLGCDKNTVDSERMLAELVAHGAERTDVDEAEVILVNTCGFIDAAKEESIETILEAERLKQGGACRSVVAVGCMVERHREEMAEALPEVDLLLGLRDLDRLVPELRSRGLLRGPRPEGGAHPGERMPVGARHVRYLKVSEGCSHTCAFCAIPLWRGKHRSFELERLVAEAQRLEAQGAVEVNLVAQDLAHWGREQRGGTGIATLVEALLRETSIPWFRLLYIYSAGLRDPLIDLMATETRLLSYIDMPIQHASDAVLRRMRRPERAATLRSKVARLREAIPGLSLRTTVLVGFPGETEAEFRELVAFLDEVPFDRLGAFAFSPQEGTRAAAMEESFVPADLARDRLEEVLEVQRAVSRERLATEVGRERIAVVDAPAAADEPTLGLLYDDPPAAAHLGRIESQADDVDGVTVLVGGNGFAGGEGRTGGSGLVPGSLVRVEIERAADFDLAGRVRDVVRRAPGRGRAVSAAAPATGRGLPVLGLDTVWGR